MQQAGSNFSIGFYFRSLAKVLGTPGAFFTESQQSVGLQQSAGFLVVSSAFFALASLTTREFDAPWLSSSIFFVNAVGMTLIAAGFGYMTLTMFWGRKVTFRKFFSVYAFASGVTLLASWIPLFVFITEPWKWIMIGIGLNKACELKWLQSIMIIVLSIGMIVLFFRSLLPVILCM
jgi:hypothetical protein